MKCFLIVLIIISAFNDSHLVWSEGRKIKWNDFEGLVEEGSPSQASISTFIEVERGHFSGGFPKFKVVTMMDKSNSWYKSGSSNRLLVHEQLHFDIAEIYSRKIRQAVDSLINKEIHDFTIYDSLVVSLLQEESEYNDLYDKQTSHSVNLDEQKRWQGLVLFELKELENYAIED